MTPQPQPARIRRARRLRRRRRARRLLRLSRLARAAACSGAPPLRAAKPPSLRLMRVAARGAAAPAIADQSAARRFFVDNFRPWRVVSAAADGAAFFTGYYEPVVDASLTQNAELSRARPGAAARPRQLRAGRRAAGPRPCGWPALRRREDGRLGALPRPRGDRGAMAAKRSPGSPTRSRSSSPRCRARRG